MHLFVSDRIEPSGVKFPKAFSSFEWKIVKTYADFCKAAEQNNIQTVVLDSASDAGLGLRCCIAITEIVQDKHVKLPTLLVIGNDADEKKKIEAQLTSSKRWIEINAKSL